MKIEAMKSKFISSIVRYTQYKYELMLFAFLILRFVFKNTLGIKTYFTAQPIFGLSEKSSFILGTVVLIMVCMYLSSIFGYLIKRNGKGLEKPVILLVSLFFACPVTLPFLFNTGILSGTQMLYPFALFLLAIYLTDKPIIQWILPFICAAYFIPAVYTSEIFFSVLLKESLLYVPLILLFNFLNIEFYKKSKSGTKMTQDKKQHSYILLISNICVSIGSYMYTLLRGKYSFYTWDSNFEGYKKYIYLLLSLLIASPALVSVGMVLYKAQKTKFSASLFNVFTRVPVFLFLVILLTKNDLLGIWVPLLTISLFMLMFCCIMQKDAAMISEVQVAGGFFLERWFAFFIVLIVMASFSNVSSTFLSVTVQKIFGNLPF